MGTPTETTPLRAVARVRALTPSTKRSSSALPAVGEAMRGTDHQDLDTIPEKTTATTGTLDADTAHLARRLKVAAHPTSS